MKISSQTFPPGISISISINDIPIQEQQALVYDICRAWAEQSIIHRDREAHESLDNLFYYLSPDEDGIHHWGILESGD